MKEIIKQISEEAKKYFEGVCPSHDWSHVERVYDLSLYIGKKEKANLYVLQLASLLHDVGRKKESESLGTLNHAEISKEIASSILKTYKINDKVISRVLHCISAHRFRKEEKLETLEAKVLFDADKLDCLGAIGVARAYAWAGSKGLKLYSDKNFLGNGYEKEHSPITEFTYKLSKVKDRMQTKTGKKLALERYGYMKIFFETLQKEIKIKI
jgi:uncharacterized protein